MNSFRDGVNQVGPNRRSVGRNASRRDIFELNCGVRCDAPELFHDLRTRMTGEDSAIDVRSSPLWQRVEGMAPVDHGHNAGRAYLADGRRIRLQSGNRL